VRKMRIYTDSSYNEKHGVAGIGCVIICGEQRRVYSNWIKVSNNNLGELYAIYYALNIARKFPGPHTIYTDSQTAIAYISNNIKDKPGTPQQLKNRLECKKWAYRINSLMPEGTKLEKVKAHTGYYQPHSINNSIADTLAKEGVMKYMMSINTKARDGKTRQ